MTYILAGDPTRIVLPDPAETASRRHELWRRTCFEVFFATPGSSGYWEGNFSPTGDWNVYSFTDYRQGMTEEARLNQPLSQLVMAPGRLEFSCAVAIHGICRDSTELAVGIACVMLDTGGRVSYWAIDHCGPAPDFHDRRSFLLRFPPLPENFA